MQEPASCPICCSSITRFHTTSYTFFHFPCFDTCVFLFRVPCAASYATMRSPPVIYYFTSADLKILWGFCMMGLCVSLYKMIRRSTYAMRAMKAINQRKKADEEECIGLLEPIASDRGSPSIPQTESQQQEPKPASKPKAAHVPWLDHAKLLGMLLVNLQHTSEMFGHASAVRDEAKPGLFGVPPVEIFSLHELWGRADMTIFFFCSGVVAKGEADFDYLRIGFVQLLLPSFMVPAWQTFVDMKPEYWFHKDFVIGSPERVQEFIADMIFQSQFWFLAGLFALRIALGVFGKMSTFQLVVVCAISSVFVIDYYKSCPWPLRMPFSYFPAFIVGFLVNKHGLLHRYLTRVRQRPLLRAVPASMAVSIVLFVLVFKDTPHRLFLRPFSATPWAQDPWGSRLLPTQCADGNAPFTMIWIKMWQFIYAFSFTGWLPVNDLGWVTRLGSRTLTAYMLFKFPIILVGKVGAFYLFDGLSVGAFWTFCYAVMPLLTAFLCSDFMTFALWPMVAPRSWAGPLVGITPGPSPSKSSPYWPIAFVLVTSSLCYMTNVGPIMEADGWGKSWWGPVPQVGQLTFPCDSSPQWTWNPDFAKANGIRQDQRS